MKEKYKQKDKERNIIMVFVQTCETEGNKETQNGRTMIKQKQYKGQSVSRKLERRKYMEIDKQIFKERRG